MSNKTYARIIDGIAVDVIHTPPSESFVPALAAQFVEVSPGVQSGWKYDGKVWTAPGGQVMPEAAPLRKPTPPQFFLLFTVQERVGIRASTDPFVIDFLRLLDDPRLTEVDLDLKSTQDALAYLAANDYLEEHRPAEILTGQLR